MISSKLGVVLAFLAFIALFEGVDAAKGLRNHIRTQIQEDGSHVWLGDNGPACAYGPHGGGCIDSAVRCNGKCSMCDERGMACLAKVSSASSIPNELQGKASFGKECSGFPLKPGDKVLCGPLSEGTGNYWVGTAPLCGGDRDDCEDKGDEYLLKAANEDEVPNAYKKDKISFGSTCISGNKVLCKRKQQ